MNYMPNFTKKNKKGDFAPINAWMQHHIHKHGRRFTADKLIQKATGSTLQIAPFISYLKEKYGKLYDVKL